MRSSLRFDRDMVVPTFVDLQGFHLGRARGFVVKEVAVLRRGNVLTHYIFTNPVPWEFLSKSEKSCSSWLTVFHHGFRWEDGVIPFWTARQLITKAVYGMIKNDDDDGDESDHGGYAKDLVYVKGFEKREWLKDLLDADARDNVIIETMDADYEDMESLNKLDATDTLHCGKHRRVKNCALQNVFKMHNWLSRRQKEL
jgi:hypothetical protein